MVELRLFSGKDSDPVWDCDLTGVPVSVLSEDTTLVLSG